MPAPTACHAVVLLSGGLDSATTAAIAQSEGFRCHAITFDYGQRHRVELVAARQVADFLQISDLKLVSLDLRAVGGSALTDEMEVPKEESSGIPITYVPARNTIFLSYALAWAEVLGIGDIFIGVNAVDYSGYPDCRPEYIQAFEQMANLATKASVEGRLTLHLHTPLIHLTKAEIIQRGITLGMDYSLTHSCYDPDDEGRACGACDSCRLRKKGFREAGITDPTRYRPAAPDRSVH